MIRNISDVQVKPEGYLLPLSIHMYENMSIMKISIGNESLYKETKHDDVTTSQAETSPNQRSLLANSVESPTKVSKVLTRPEVYSSDQQATANSSKPMFHLSAPQKTPDYLKILPRLHSKCPYKTPEVTQKYPQSNHLVAPSDPEVHLE